MKKYVFNSLAFASVAVAVAGCGGLGKMIKKADTVMLTVTPSPLEMHGDTVKVAISGKIPAKYFHKKAIVKATPVMKYKGGGEKELKTVTLKGETAEGDGQAIKYAEGGSFSYADAVPYEGSMKNCELVLKIQGAIKSKTAGFPERKVADGTIVTPLLVMSDEKPMMGPHNYGNMPPVVHLAKIYFQKNKTNVRPTEKNGDQMADLKEFVKKYQKEKGTFQSLSMTGWASPEGQEELNQNLSKGRASNSLSVLKGDLKGMKVEAAGKDDFWSEAARSGDWEGFQKLLNTSDLDAKSEVMNIVKSDPNPPTRDKKIRDVSSNYQLLEKEIFPQLRRAEVRLAVKKKEFTQEEIKNYATSKPDTLSEAEMLYAATLYEEDDKKLQIYRKFSERFPQDWRGPNNVGSCLLKARKLDEAENEFKKAQVLAPEESAVKNNLGIVARWKGDLAKAYEHYTSVSGPGAETSYNLGVYSIIVGDYTAANKYLGESCEFNTGLARLLGGNAAGAEKAVDCSPEAKTANGYYLKAIAGARQGSKDTMLSNLKSAIGKDASFGAKAREDLEFHKYFADADFKAAVGG